MPVCNLYYYNSVDLENQRDLKKENSDRQLFLSMFKLFSPNLSFHDRSGKISTPINTLTLDACQLPAYDNKFSKDYKEICQLRARKLLDHVIETDQKLTVLYSGGIDSTTILVSLLMAGTQYELNKYVLVLLSDKSIKENPNFYYKYIVKNFNCAPSYNFNRYLGAPGYMVINGEGNDQLFGSALLYIYKDQYGDGIFSRPMTEDLMIELVNLRLNDIETSKILASILEKMFVDTPISLPTVFHRFWWINFTLKWQCVYLRLLAWSQSRYQNNIKPEYNYSTFFHDKDFQLWSMKNSSDLIPNSWNDYKWHSKKMIYDFNKDRDYYLNKTKQGSLSSLCDLKKPLKAIGSNMTFYDEYPENIWNEDSDFKKS
jgi:hypothetical protein